MRNLTRLTLVVAFVLLSLTVQADEVSLPAPVLEWSFYILLIFASFVAVGIFFFRSGNDKTDQTIETMLDQLEPTIYSVGPDDTVSDCIRQMNQQDIGAILVIENDELLGIFTERDALTKVLGTGLEPSYTKVSAVMTNNPICISPSTTVEQALAIVTQQRVRHLPMLRDGKIIGLVSSGDLTHWLIRERSPDALSTVDGSGDNQSTIY